MGCVDNAVYLIKMTTFELFYLENYCERRIRIFVDKTHRQRKFEAYLTYPSNFLCLRNAVYGDSKILYEIEPARL